MPFLTNDESNRLLDKVSDYLAKVYKVSLIKEVETLPKSHLPNLLCGEKKYIASGSLSLPKCVLI